MNNDIEKALKVVDILTEEKAINCNERGFLRRAILKKAPTVEDMPRICQAPSIYHEPMENNYKKVIDNGSPMLECPKCTSRINANAFTYAVGTAGYAFCPYCGHDLRKRVQLTIDLLPQVVEIAKEKPETRACFNCKHNGKKFYNAPCNVCSDNLNCWEEDSQASQQNETK